jgi:hypothetical protein
LTFTAKLRRSAVASAAVAVATAGMLVTAGAEAGAMPEGASRLPAPAQCASYGWVVVTAGSLSMFSGPGLNYPTVGPVLHAGHRLSCFPVEAHGSRYSLCGYSSVNGWIPIDRDGDFVRDAYVPSVCVVDE